MGEMNASMLLILILAAAVIGFALGCIFWKQKDSLKEYMKKIKDIKLRVPEEYLEPIKEHAKKKGMSVNQLIISLLEKDMGMDIVTIREQNKQSKENDEE